MENIIMRPQNLNDFIGQSLIKENLKIFINAAIKREECLDHIIISGPSGFGKTTLARIIKNEMNRDIKFTNGTSFKNVADIISVVTSLKKGDILFIDEIHCINHTIEECLYSIMEDYRLDIVVGEGLEKRCLNIDVEHFTLIGATTNLGGLSRPFRNRFGINFVMQNYNDDEIDEIIKYYFSLYKINVEDACLCVLRKVSKQTPRIIHNIVRRIRDFELKNNTLKYKKLNAILKTLGFDETGLENVEVQIIRDFYKFFKNGPVGIDAIIKIIDIDRNSMIEIYEPNLIKEGYINRTSRGRMLTQKALDLIKE
ncbi:MAG: Holliday junction branch migration DNA helicase RuvB [Mycoplasmatales bacterium]